MSMFMENYRKQQQDVIETPNVEITFFAEAYQVSEDAGIIITLNELYSDVKDMMYSEAEGDKKEGFIRKIINFLKKIGNMFVKVAKSVLALFYKNKDKDRNIVYYIQKELEAKPKDVEKNKTLKEKFSDIMAGIKNGEIAKFIARQFGFLSGNPAKRANIALDKSDIEYTKLFDNISKIQENITKIDIAEATKNGLADELAKDMTRISKYITFKMNVILALKYVSLFTAQANAIISTVIMDNIEVPFLMNEDERLEIIRKSINDPRFKALLKSNIETHSNILLYITYIKTGTSKKLENAFNDMHYSDILAKVIPLFAKSSDEQHKNIIKKMTSGNIKKQVEAIKEYADELKDPIYSDDKDMTSLMDDPSKSIQDITKYMTSKVGNIEQAITDVLADIYISVLHSNAAKEAIREVIKDSMKNK